MFGREVSMAVAGPADDSRTRARPGGTRATTPRLAPPRHLLQPFVRSVTRRASTVLGCGRGGDPPPLPPSKDEALALSDVVYRVYARRLQEQVRAEPLPQHVGVILDGNRRFAKEKGRDARSGHLAGAHKIDEFLDWCWDLGIPYVTLWMLSTDNLDRDDQEVAALLEIISDTVSRLSTHPNARDHGLRVQAMGALELLPEEVREALRLAEELTADNDGLHLQVAVGYGGRREIVDALRSLLEQEGALGKTPHDIAAELSVDSLDPHLYTQGLPDPDLIIRTSGEVRMSGFLLWQSAHSEFYFCDPYWPDFRLIDFLRALREFQHRHRRFGR